jgi:hypothetical protein
MLRTVHGSLSYALTALILGPILVKITYTEQKRMYYREGEPMLGLQAFYDSTQAAGEDKFVEASFIAVLMLWCPCESKNSIYVKKSSRVVNCGEMGGFNFVKSLTERPERPDFLHSI